MKSIIGKPPKKQMKINRPKQTIKQDTYYRNRKGQFKKQGVLYKLRKRLRKPIKKSGLYDSRPP